MLRHCNVRSEVVCHLNSCCELTENNCIKNNAHSVEPINIYKIKTDLKKKESFDLRRHRSRIAYFPFRKTDADFGLKKKDRLFNHTFPVSVYSLLHPFNPWKFVRMILLFLLYIIAVGSGSGMWQYNIKMHIKEMSRWTLITL